MQPQDFFLVSRIFVFDGLSKFFEVYLFNWESTIIFSFNRIFCKVFGVCVERRDAGFMECLCYWYFSWYWKSLYDFNWIDHLESCIRLNLEVYELWINIDFLLDLIVEKTPASQKRSKNNQKMYSKTFPSINVT